MIVKRKLFTKYDETDRLKEMKDSDILAERKKKTGGWGNVVGNTISGGALGGAAGATLGAGVVGGMAIRNRSAASLGKNLLNASKKAGIAGAVAGGVLAGGLALRKRNKNARDNKFYNDRLEYAQRQAQRRERKNWKQNMTQREDYTY